MSDASESAPSSPNSAEGQSKELGSVKSSGAFWWSDPGKATKFFFKNRDASTLVGNSLNLVGLSTCLAVLNNLSGAAELGGAEWYFLAIDPRDGHFTAFSLQYSRRSSLVAMRGSFRYSVTSLRSLVSTLASSSPSSSDCDSESSIAAQSWERDIHVC